MIAITNRDLCNGDYFEQIKKIAKLKPKAILLRENDITKEEYLKIASNVKMICDKYCVSMIVHSYIDVAKKIGCRNIHMSVATAKMLSEIELIHCKRKCDIFSISCHSEDDVRFAESVGANQIILGTIFETDCKKGLKGSGVSFVRSMSEITDIPIYAIGGIKKDNIEKVIKAGSAGGCMMSGFMKI